MDFQSFDIIWQFYLINYVNIENKRQKPLFWQFSYLFRKFLWKL